MTIWPLEGGTTGIVSVDRNLRGILRRGGELAASALTKSEGAERFLSLLVPGEKKLAKGTTELEWPGGSPTSNGKSIEHKLGAEPSQVLATSRTNGCIISCIARSSTKLELQAFYAVGGSPGAGGKITVDWIALT